MSNYQFRMVHETNSGIEHLLILGLTKRLACMHHSSLEGNLYKKEEMIQIMRMKARKQRERGNDETTTIRPILSYFFVFWLILLFSCVIRVGFRFVSLNALMLCVLITIVSNLS